MKKVLFFTMLLLFGAGSLFATDSQYLWAKSANSTNAVIPLRMKFDGSGNLYVLYSFSGSITISGSSRTSRGGKDFCLAKFDPNGTLVWMRTGGTPADDDVNALEIDASGNVYVLGSFLAGTASFDNSNTGITTSATSSSTISTGLSAALLIRYDQTGASGNYFAQILKQSSGTGLSVSVSDMVIAGSSITFVGNLVTNTSSGSITYVVGANNGAGGQVSSANKRCYIASISTSTFNRAGSATLYEMTKTQIQGVYGISYDGSNYYISGSFQGTIVAGTNLAGLPSPQTQDIFLLKLNSTFAKQWVKLIQGDGDELPIGLKVYSGGIYFASTFSSTNLNVCTAGDGLLGTFKEKAKASSATDVLVLKYDSSTGNLVWDFNTPAGSVSTGYPLTSLDVSAEFVACSFVLNGSAVIEPDVLTSSSDDGVFCLLDPSNGTTKGAEIIQSTGSLEQSTVVAFNSEGKVHLGGMITSSSKSLGDYQITSTSGIPNAYVAKFCPLVRLYGLKSTYSTTSVGTVITLTGTPGDGSITSTTNTMNQSYITLQEGANTCTYTVTKSGACLNSYTKTATVSPCYSANDITIVHNSSYCMSASQVQLVAFVGSEQNPVGGGFTENGSFISKSGSVYTMDPASANEGMNAIEYSYSTAACPTITKVDSANFIQGPSANLNLGSTTGCAIAEFSISASPMGSQFDVCNLTITAGETAQEEFVFNNIALDQAYTFHPQFAEGYNLHVHMEYNGCTKDQYDNIGTYSYTVYPNPAVTFSGTSTVCVNGSTQLTVEVSGASSPYTYSWNGGGSSYTKSYNNLLNTTNAIITVTDSRGCHTEATQVITVNSPSISLTPSSSSVCQNSSATLTATAGYNSYTWSAGTSSTGTLGVVTVSPTVSTTYTVTGTDAIGCTATASQSITVNPLPSVTLTTTPSSGAICAGSSAAIQSSAGSSYLWSTGATTGSISPSIAGTYNVTVTDGNGCQNSTTVGSTITVNSLPSLSLSTAQSGVCSGASTYLTANGADTYEWSTGATARGASPYIADVTPSSTTQYRVTGTNTSTGCTNTSSYVPVTVWNPTVTITPTTPMACPSSTTSITAAGAGTSGYSYVWNTTPSTTAGATLATAAAGSAYTVTVTDSHNCTATANVTVGTASLPNVIVSGTNVICQGSSTTLSVTGADTYTWSTGATGTSIIVNPNVTTTYTVTGHNNTTGCDKTVEYVVTVNARPTVTIAPSDASVCNGLSTTITASGATSYVWNNAKTTASISESPSITTTYTVTGTDANGCQNTVSQAITVWTPVVSISPSSPVVCAGSTTAITVNASGTSDYTYLWNTNETTSSVTKGAGNYSVTVTDAHNCTVSASKTITANSLPTISISGDSEICTGSSTTLTASGAISYVWNTAAATAAITVNPSINTTYTVTGTNASGCTATASVEVVINALPTVTLNASSAAFCNGGNTMLTAGGASSYKWSTAPLVSTNDPELSVSPTTNTTYTVTGTDANGCLNTASQTITVYSLPTATISPVSAIVCPGANVTLTAEGASGAAPYSYNWGAVSQVSTASVGAGEYSVTVSDSHACTTTASKTVTSHGAPTVVIAGESAVCLGSSTVLTASGASTYVWSTSDITASVTVSPSIESSYSVVGTDTYGCTATVSKTISVNALPEVTISSNPANATVCAGDNIILTQGGNASTYTWSDNSTGTSLTLTPANSVTVTLTGTNANCTATATQAITVTPKPSVTITIPSKTIFTGENTTFTATGATTYAWSNSLGTDATSVSISSAGTYTVTGTTNGCSNTASAVLDVLTACTWNGSVWVGGYAPNATKDVTINGRYKGASIDCKDLIVNDSLIVDSGKYIVVNGNFTNNNAGAVLIKSLPTGNTTVSTNPIRKDGSMIFKGIVSNTGSFKVEQYYTAGAIAHWISIPVSPVNAGTYINQGNIRTFVDGSISTYGTKLTDLNQIISVGKGYNFEKITSGSFTISGTPNTGNYTYTLTKGVNGRSMMGNPYTSAIDLESAGWTYVNAKTAFAVWNPILKNYSTYNSTTHVGSNGGGRYIASGQGYWVLANDNTAGSATPTISYTPSIQVASVADKFKSDISPKENHQIHIKMNGLGVQDEAIVLFYDGATYANDLFDSYKAFNTVFDVYMIADSGSVCVNAIPLQENQLNQNVYIKSKQDAICSLTIVSDDFINNKPIVLENVQTGEIIPVAEVKDYSVNVKANDSLYFRLKQYTEVSSIEDLNINCSAYSENGIIRFNTPNRDVKIEIYDICGRKLTEQYDNHSYDANKYKQSILLVTFISKVGKISKKLVIN